MTSRIRKHLASLSADGRIFSVLSAVGFSFKAVFAKLAYSAGPVDALTLLALRMGMALPLFMWVLYKSRTEESPPLTRSNVFHILILAGVGSYLSNLFDFKGLQYISAGLERLILFIFPTIVLLLNAAQQKRWPEPRTWKILAICYFGLSIAFFNDLRQNGSSHDVAVGAAWVSASAFTYALYYVGTGNMVARIGSMRLTGLVGVAACIMVLAHFLIVRNVAAALELPGPVWTYAFLMALLSTVLPIWWLALAIQRLGAGPAAAIGAMGPVLTVLGAWLILGEPLSTPQILGLAMVIFGVVRLKPGSGRPKASNGARTESESRFP